MKFISLSLLKYKLKLLSKINKLNINNLSNINITLV
jgi:hypothetical protein